jgi:hypothetical protein
MLRRTGRQPTRQQGIRVGVGIAVVGAAVRLRDRVRLSSQSPVQSFGGQFCSHTPTLGAPTVATTPSRG